MKRHNRKSLFLAAITLVAMVAAPLTVWGGGGLRVDACVPVGDSVVVKVANMAPNSQSGTLSITAIVDGSALNSMTSVIVEGGSATHAVVGFGGQVDEVLIARIMDDSNPY